MPDEWRTMRWGDLVTLQYGKALRGYEDAHGSYRVFGTNGPIGWHEAPLCRHPTVVVGRKGAYRGIHYSQEQCFVIDTAFYLEPRSQFDMRWAYYELLTQNINSMDSGSAIPSTSRDSFYRLQVNVPPLSEQQAIARALGSLDDKIELNQRMNETLEEMACAIFESWFVNFDPVRAKSERRQAVGIDAKTAALFPHSFQDSPLGKIPSGWDVGPITGRANLLSGGTPKTDCKEYWNGDILWASAKDVSQCSDAFLSETERTITDKGLTESSTQIIPAFCTVIVARGATTGRMVLLGCDMAMNQTCYALSTTINAPFFLYCLLREGVSNLVHTAHGSVFDTITTSTFASYRVISPPNVIVQAFDSTVAPIFNRILANTRESSILRIIGNALLPKLMSGELRIKDVAANSEVRE